MRIAIYHPWIYLKSGLERTIMEIKRRSHHDWVICTSHYDPDGTYPEFRDLDVQELNRVSVTRKYSSVIGAAGRIATTRLDRLNVDAMLVCCDGLGGFLHFANPRLPSACLCFTPLRAVYDPVYRERYLARTGVATSTASLMEWGFRLIDKLAWRRYRRIFCISNEVRARVLDAGLSEPDKIRVVYSGIDASQLHASDEREPYFFLPGRIMWTKNIELGIRAFQRFRQGRGDNFRLVIAGMVDAKSRDYFNALMAEARDIPEISFVESPSDDTMQSLYRRCHAVLLTAFNEDFGITPMEAGAHGKTVIAVNCGGPREVVLNGETGYLAEPEPEAFAAKMRQLADDPELVKRLGLNNLERAKLFTWDEFVTTLDAYFDELQAELKSGR